MLEAFILFSLTGITLVSIFIYRKKRHERLLERLRGEGEGSPTYISRLKSKQGSIFKKPLWIPFVGAGVIFLIFFYGLKFVFPFSIALAFLVGLLIRQGIDVLISRQAIQIEEQLAEFIDLMISNLQAGGSLLNSLEKSLYELKKPLKPQIDELLARLRLGEDPKEVFSWLAQRVPLDSFRLFALNMSIHWSAGGRLVPLLSIIGKSVRDRIEVSRQMRLATTQSRMTAFFMIGMTYVLAFMVWRFNPDRLIGFVNSPIGIFAVSGALFLQGIGIFWASKISELKY